MFAVVASQGQAEVKATVTVLVTDANDNPPKFESERFRWVIAVARTGGHFGESSELFSKCHIRCL